MNNLIRRVCLIISLLLTPAYLTAAEEILDFHSDIRIFESGEMLVTETIRVRAEGNRIRRGIYRDFPTRYKDRYGNRYQVGFQVESISRNGITEAYRIQKQGNGVRIYIGRENRTIARGEHTYAITYRTNRQLGFFDRHDELYWNVTGNDWGFPINQASASIALPHAVPMSEVTAEAYTGKFGSKEQNYRSEIYDDVYFKTTRSLPPGHGLTIVVTWPKGFVNEPTFEEKLDYFFQDNRHVLTGLAGILVILAYYLMAWYWYGKDPEAGVIFPHYQPPKGYSPASMRFVENMGYDKTCFAAAVLNLAVKGYLSITEDSSGKYTLKKTEGSDNPLAAGEKTILKSLFTTADSIKLTQSNHKKISAAIKAHKTSLKANYEKNYFVTNRALFIVGIVLTLVVTVIAYVSGASSIDPAVLFLCVWLSFWTLGVFTMLKSAWLLWQNIASSVVNIIPAVFITLFAIPFVGAEIFVSVMLIKMGGLSLLTIILLTILTNWVFYELLKAPTLAGRKLLDKIEGFKNYIEIAEKHDLDYRYRGGRTPELFETYLPYAVALGIEQKWSEQFADVLAAASAEKGGYSPHWYHGHGYITDFGNFGSSLSSSFSQAIASSSTAPGSSSGSGGGGSSGGGGGGGGGGGW